MAPEYDVPERIGYKNVTFRYSNPDFLEADQSFIRKVETNGTEGGYVIIFLDVRDSSPFRISPTDNDASIHYALIATISAGTPGEEAWDQTGDLMPLPIFAHITGFAEDREGEYFLPEDTFLRVVDLLNEVFDGRVFLADSRIFSAEEGAVLLVGAPGLNRGNINLLQYVGQEIPDIENNEIREAFRLLCLHRSDPGDQFIEVSEVIEYMKLIPGTLRLGMETVHGSGG